MNHLLWYILGMIVLANPALSQSGLFFQRAVNKWPQVELYIAPQCDGHRITSLDPAQIYITDNGTAVENLDVTCADPMKSYSFSVAIVADASGSMSGPGNEGAKMAFSNFVKRMDGAKDEAAFFWQSGTVHREQEMTSDTSLLQKAVGALPAIGPSTVWDGVYAALWEVIQNGTNDVRALITLHDGGSCGDSRTPDEIITLANAHGIRVFTIGLGEYFPASQLETISMLTGGKYFACASPQALLPAVDSCFLLLRSAFNDCRITYDASLTHCPDGAQHKVNLALINICGDTLRADAAYRAPIDPSVYHLPTLAADSVRVFTKNVFSAPLVFTHPVPMTLEPAEFRFTYDTTLLEFRKVCFAGTRFLDSPLPFHAENGVVTVVLDTAVEVLDSFKLGAIRFTVRTDAHVTTTVQLDTVISQRACFRASGGPVRIISIQEPLPIYRNAADSLLCHGQKATLRAPGGLASYFWNTGARTSLLVADASGEYSFMGITIKGDTVYSETVRITKSPYPPVGLVNSRNALYVCPDTVATLAAMPGYRSYRMFGDWTDSPEFQPTVTGHYSIQAIDSCGCYSISPTIWVQYLDESALKPVIYVNGNTLESTAAETYQWYRGASKLNGATQRTYVPASAGNYSVIAGYYGNCSTRSDEVNFQPVGVQPLSASAFSVDVYPEPNRGSVTLGIQMQNAGAVRVQISDLLGRTVYEHTAFAQPGTFTFAPDVSGLHEGMYFVRVTAGSRKSVKSMTIVR